MIDQNKALTRRRMLKGTVVSGFALGATTGAKAATQANGLPPVSFEYSKGYAGSEASDRIETVFDARFCVHARHCVTRLSQVFRPNLDPWMDPSAEDPDLIASVIQMCPSGALQFNRLDGELQEQAPNNVVVMRENGPYEFRGTLNVDGREVGYRRTLCRCGLSGNMPYCDNSHVGEFVASGVAPPVSADTTAAQDAWLENPKGALSVTSRPQEPLTVTGSVQLVSGGDGATIAFGEKFSLCSCGKSKNKPFCDGAHNL